MMRCYRVMMPCISPVAPEDPASLSPAGPGLTGTRNSGVPMQPMDQTQSTAAGGPGPRSCDAIAGPPPEKAPRAMPYGCTVAVTQPAGRLGFRNCWPTTPSPARDDDDMMACHAFPFQRLRLCLFLSYVTNTFL